MILSKVTFIAFKLFILSFHAFPTNCYDSHPNFFVATKKQIFPSETVTFSLNAWIAGFES